MRQLIVLCSTILLGFHSQAQEAFSHFNEIIPVVKGQLEGYDVEKDTVLVLTFHCVIPSPDRNRSIEVTPNNDGSFEFQLPNQLRYQQIWFKLGDYYDSQLIVDKGLTIIADMNNLREESEENYYSKHVQFSGEDGELCTYINQYIDYEIPRRDEIGDWALVTSDRSLSVEERVKKVKDIFAKKAQVEAEFVAAHPSEYAWVLENERLSKEYGLLFVLHWGTPMPEDMQKEAFAHRPKLISNNGCRDYYGYLNILFKYYDVNNSLLDFYQKDLLPKVAHINDEKIRLENLIELQKMYMNKEYIDNELWQKERAYFFKQYREESMKSKFRKIVERADHFFQGEQNDMLKLIHGNDDIWDREMYMEIVKPTLENDWAKEIMQNEWDKVSGRLKMAEERLSNIQISENASPMGKSIGKLDGGGELLLAEQDEVEDILASIRATYPGKAIILDVWATWCGPCIHDMQNCAENLAKLKAMDVQVVYLCTTSGTTEEKWKKKVSELNLNAPQIYMTERLSKNIMSFFDLKGFPSHILLDKEGKYQPDFHSFLARVDFDELERLLK